MQRSKPLKQISVISLLLLHGCGIFAPEYPGEEQTIYLQSSVLNTEYELKIYVPEGEAGYTGKNSVLVVLDGDETYSSSLEVLCDLQSKGIFPNLILVSIGYGDGNNLRTRDYTPSSVSDQEGSGGGQGFLTFLGEELLPYFEVEFNVSSDPLDHIIDGHSFGGLLVLQAMLSRQDLFHKYIASSPSLWWDASKPFEFLENYQQLNDSLDISLYLSVGSQEGGGMTTLFNEYVDRLKKFEDFGMNLKHYIIPKKRHWNNRYVALEGGLRFFYD